MSIHVTRRKREKLQDKPAVLPQNGVVTLGHKQK